MDAELRSLEREFHCAPDRELLQRLATTLSRAGDGVLGDWLHFLGGHWTLTPPSKPGLYWTKDRQHNIAWCIPVFELNGQLVVSTSLRDSAASDRWKGYWWSEPMPNMPSHTAGDK